jgi:hypothetical protein
MVQRIFDLSLIFKILISFIKLKDCCDFQITRVTQRSKAKVQKCIFQNAVKHKEINLKKF